MKQAICLLCIMVGLGFGQMSITGKSTETLEDIRTQFMAVKDSINDNNEYFSYPIVVEGDTLNGYINVGIGEVVDTSGNIQDKYIKFTYSLNTGFTNLYSYEEALVGDDSLSGIGSWVEYTDHAFRSSDKPAVIETYRAPKANAIKYLSIGYVVGNDTLESHHMFYVQTGTPGVVDSSFYYARSKQTIYGTLINNTGLYKPLPDEGIFVLFTHYLGNTDLDVVLNLTYKNGVAKVVNVLDADSFITDNGRDKLSNL